ncbi:TetR/AcrR family transcriptional regulator [Chryseobacterium terrae]|uniref:Helix-turn-helix domain-containing protein n=1 Tax=Chryseobacterium terrae TaxID=3163299 RepID=A0ABW8Y1J2_9FLAO
MGSKERILRKKTKVSEEIFKVAMDILASEGIDGISIRKIASRIEYSPPVIYAHYRDKNELINKMVSVGFAMLRKQISLDKSKSNKPIFQLEHLFHNYIDFAIANKPLYLLMSRKAVERIGTDTLDDAEDFAKFCKEKIQSLLPLEKNSLVINQIYNSMISLVHGLICTCYATNTFSVKERDYAIRTMISGFTG